MTNRKISSQLTENQMTSNTTRIVTDGGLPISTIFEKTGANRISELEWVEDEQNRLYAYIPADSPDKAANEYSLTPTETVGLFNTDKIIPQKETSIVRIDTKEATVEIVSEDIFSKDIEFNRVDNNLSGSGD